MLPGVRRHGNVPGGAAAFVDVTVRLKDGSVLGRVRAVTLPVAMATVFGREPLRVGTAPADALKRLAVSSSADAVDVKSSYQVESSVQEARHVLRTGAERTRFERQWDFADGLAESPGESLSRALIHESGFVVPDLQRRLYDGEGRLLARVDFWWEEIRLAGEFDGFVKYTAALASTKATGAEGQHALVQEKLREDGIRRAGNNLARWVWADLMDSRRLSTLLEEFHVPRRR
ncbi:hypothetical protein GCM10009670_14760 [Citricoccus alkalitolerans]